MFPLSFFQVVVHFKLALVIVVTDECVENDGNKRIYEAIAQLLNQGAGLIMILRVVSSPHTPSLLAVMISKLYVPFGTLE